MDAEVVPLRRARLSGPQTSREKIGTLEDVALIAERLRKSGKKVVQAHGTFDLLHVGHLRHFEAARALGNVLIVTVTADRFVNKGPGRPVFTNDMRAEMLASLAPVDYVAINHQPDAVNAIMLIRPDVYVKGQDYEQPEADITARIVAEQQAVEACGGRICFTHEIMFSSSELINRHFNVYEPMVARLLKGLRSDGALKEILELIERVRDYCVVLVGDAIIDEYQYVLPMGKPPKENVLATHYQNHELFAGGVFAAANHVASFCKHVHVITCLGDHDSYEELIRSSLRSNVMLHALRRPGAPTVLKRRFVDPSYMRKLFELYVMNEEPLADGLQSDLDRLISDLAPQADVVIAADFGHGLIGPSAVQTLTESARFLAVSSQSNSANMGYNLITKYPRADYVCIDAPEARLALGDRLSPIGDVARRLVSERVDCPNIIITHGKHGCVSYRAGEAVHTIPALAQKIVDTIGAGDAFLSVTAPLVAAGGSMDRIGFVGNVVGALKVEIVGHRKSIEKSALIKSITALLK